MEPPKLQIRLLQNILGLRPVELAHEILGSRTQSLGQLNNCAHGKNSLKNKPAALKNIVNKFGLRPECLITEAYLRALSSVAYTPLWFLAWTYSGLSLAVDCPLDSLALALRIHRAAELHFTFLKNIDPMRTDFATQEDFDNDDRDWTSRDWWKGLEVPKNQSLWSHRNELSKALFDPISALVPEPSPKSWLNEYIGLNERYHLLPVYDALQLSSGNR